MLGEGSGCLGRADRVRGRAEWSGGGLRGQEDG